MKEIITYSIEETENLAREWLSSIKANEDEAVTIGLYGNLGSGKTTFTKAVAKALGIEKTITSPTFVIEKIYEIENKPFARLIHIDAYRLESANELQLLNFEELIENKNNLIIIEWPENIKEILPENHIKIHCEFVNENSRKFIF